MALICNLVNLAGQEGAGKNGKAEKSWRVGKSESVDLKARKKLTAGERKCFKRVGGNRIEDCGGVVCVRKEHRILNLLVKSSVSREMSCGMKDQQT